MRADEYIVQQLIKTEDALMTMTRNCEKLNERYDKLEAKTKRHTELLDELKQHCVMSKSGSLKTIKIVHDQEFLLKRKIAYSDEHIFDILLELLGPLQEEEQ